MLVAAALASTLALALAALTALALVPGGRLSGDSAGRASAQAPNTTWRHAASWPLPPPPALPLSLALDPTGRLYVADGRTRRVAVFDAAGAPIGGWPIDGMPMALAWDDPSGVVLVLVATVAGPRVEAWQPDGVQRWSDPVNERLLRGQEDLLAVDLSRSADGIGPTVFYNGEASVYDRASGALVRGPLRSLANDGRPMRMAVLSRTLLAAIEPLQQRVVLSDIARGVRATASMTDVVPLAVAAGPLLPLVPPPAAMGDGSGGPAVPVGPVVAYVLARGVARDRIGLVVIAIAPDGHEVGRWMAPAAYGGAPGDDAFRWSLAVGADGMAYTRGVERLSVERWDAAGGHRFSLGMGRPAAPFGRRAAQNRANLVSASTALALAPGAADTVAVLDGAGSRILALAASGAAAGSPVRETILPYDVTDFTAEPAGMPAAAFYLSTADERLRRVVVTADVARYTDPWSADCACPLGGRLALGERRLWVTRPATHRLATLGVDDGRADDLAKAGAIGLWPFDLAAAADGTADVFSADTLGGVIERYRPGDGVPAAVWQSGVLAGPRRLAAGTTADGLAVVAALLTDGSVEVHDAGGGNVVDAFTPRLASGEAVSGEDILFANDGAILIADAARQAVHVFRPAPRETPTPDPNATPRPTPGVGACRVMGDKAVGPNRILLGETAAVTLSLAVDCPGQPRLVGADVMLVIDRSTSMGGDGLAAAKAAALEFIAQLDVRVHQIGLVSFGSDVRLEAALGPDPAFVSNAVLRLTAGGETNLGAALLAAGRHLEARRRPDAQPVIIVLTDGHDTIGDEDPVATAAWLKGWGVQLYAVGLGESADRASLEALATDPEHVFLSPSPGDLVPIYAQIVRRVGTTGLVANLTIDDDLTSSIALVPISAQPPALERSDGLSWSRAILPDTGFAGGYLIRPQAVGRYAVSRAAVARWTDALGTPHAYAFPTVEIEVALPTATPTTTPTATPEPFRAYLPALWRTACLPAPKPADVVMLIDTSSSMTGDKLAQAQTAAKTFVRLLDLPRDHALVLAFDELPRATTGLTGDRTILEAAIDGLTIGNGTRIDRALEAADAALAPTRSDPNRRAIVVLLTDGGQSGPLPPVLAAAAALRTNGTIVYAIALGPDADRALLAQIAGPDRLFTAPTAADLAAIYAQVAAVTGCR
ncbi:MAG: VWA domain-containing protein [Ardenticatenales bacterium]